MTTEIWCQWRIKASDGWLQVDTRRGVLESDSAFNWLERILSTTLDWIFTWVYEDVHRTQHGIWRILTFQQGGTYSDTSSDKRCWCTSTIIPSRRYVFKLLQLREYVHFTRSRLICARFLEKLGHWTNLKVEAMLYGWRLPTSCLFGLIEPHLQGIINYGAIMQGIINYGGTGGFTANSK